MRGIGLRILAGLSVRHMRLLHAPKRYHGLGGFGLEIVEYGFRLVEDYRKLPATVVMT